MPVDLGDVYTLAVEITSDGTTLANATSVSLTVTLPDGTTSGSLTPSNPSTGVYQYDYTPSQVGRHSVRWVATGTNAGAFTDVFDVADPALLPVVSLAELKTALKLTGTTSDEILRGKLDTATALVERRLGRAIRRKTLTETHAGGGPGILLRQPPALSVSSVTENGTSVAASGYFLRTSAGVLYRGSATAPSCWASGDVVVTYVAGSADPDPDICDCVLRVAKWLYQSEQNLGGRFGVEESPYAGDAVPDWLFRTVDSMRLPL
jgi:hypothetical protein